MYTFEIPCAFHPKKDCKRVISDIDCGVGEQTLLTAKWMTHKMLSKKREYEEKEKQLDCV